MAWSEFLAIRFARLLAVSAILVVFTFLMIRLAPGDPARLIGGLNADPDVIERLRRDLHLDEPWMIQFYHYISGLIHLDLGTSFSSGRPVATVLGERLVPTLELALFSLIFIVVVGVFLGIGGAIATRKGKRVPEILFSAGTGLTAALPEYLVATFLAFLFAVTWRLFPVAGGDSLIALVLPGVAIGIRPAMVVARLLRIRTLEVLESAYVRTARSKRLSAPMVYLRHIFPNAITTVVAMSGVIAASLVGGAVIVEQVFARPGLGTALVDAILVRDYTMVQGITLVFGIFVVVVNAFSDVLLGLIDPRTIQERR